MKTLFLIRHAKSSWAQPGLRDFDRPLNERGMNDAPAMAQLLRARLPDTPVTIVSSPAKRALTTARFFAEALRIGEESIVRNQHIYEATLYEVLQIIQNLPDSADVVLLFGHNPTFTAVANYFSEDLIDNLPTCGIVQINTTAQKWSDMNETNSEAVWSLFPKNAEY